MSSTVTPTTETTSLEGKKVLWVEDDTFLSSIIGPRCIELGIRLQLAVDGESALRFLQKESFDLIILDLMLPAVDGMTVLERVKSDEKTRHTPVIVLSNLGEAAQIERATSLGAALFMVKAEYSLDNILQKMAETLKTSVPRSD